MSTLKKAPRIQAGLPAVTLATHTGIKAVPRQVESCYLVNYRQQHVRSHDRTP